MSKYYLRETDKGYNHDWLKSPETFEVSSVQYKLRFSGHETFPLRYGWLNKAASYLYDNGKIKTGTDEEVEKAVIHLGVGKNMVNSVRYWADVSGISKSNGELSVFGQYLLTGDSSVKSADPFLEDIASVWLIHWHMNRNFSELTALRWFFNFFNGQTFNKQMLIDGISNFLDKENCNHPAIKSLEKDVDCFLGCYAKEKSKTVSEDSFSSQLVELGLIRQLPSKSYYAELADTRNIAPEIFAYCLVDFWLSKKTVDNDYPTTISFENLLTAPGSPGRIFRMSQSYLSKMLDEVENLSNGKIAWTDTQGLRQIQCQDIKEYENGAWIFLDNYYQLEN